MYFFRQSPRLFNNKKTCVQIKLKAIYNNCCSKQLKLATRYPLVRDTSKEEVRQLIRQELHLLVVESVPNSSASNRSKEIGSATQKVQHGIIILLSLINLMFFPSL